MPGIDGVTVEIFPAGVGDSILLRCAVEGRAINILVDGGVRKTYEDQLRRRLLELRTQGERLDVLIVTHIDSDHIGGALSLLKANGRSAAPSVIAIGDIWHNGYRHLNLYGRRPTDDEKRRVLNQVHGIPDTDSRTGDISFREGDTFARLIRAGGYSWNEAWGKGPIVAGGKASIAPGLDVRILSPNLRNLEALAYHWRRGLQSMGVSFEAVNCAEFEDAFEKVAVLSDEGSPSPESSISASVGYEPPPASAFAEDTSLTNGSSIGFVVNCSGFRGLFLADSWPSVVAEEWEKLPQEERGRQVDLVKIAHHGSQHNTSPAFLRLLAARHYIVSTDGTKHGHPDMAALLWIAASAPKGAALVFNYPTASAVYMNQPEARVRFGHDLIHGDGRMPVRLSYGALDGPGSSNA